MLRSTIVLISLLIGAAVFAQNRPVVGPVINIAPTALVVPTTSRAAASQTADLFEGVTIGGGVLWRVSATGDVWVQNTLPQFRLSDTDAGANAKFWAVRAQSGVLTLDTRTDADTAGQTAWSVTRSGTAVTDQALSIGGAAILQLGTTVPAAFTSSLTLSSAGTLLRFYGNSSTLGALRGNTVGGLGVLEARGADDAAFADVRVLDEVYISAWNGNIAVPTKNAVYDKIESLNISNFALQFGALSFDPVDVTTYYEGGQYAVPLASAGGLRPVYIPRSGTIKAVYLSFVNGVPGTAETSTISLRKNNTTDTTLSSVVDNSAGLQAVAATGLAVAVAAGDYVEIKWVTPAWATNPTAVLLSGTIYIE